MQSSLLSDETINITITQFEVNNLPQFSLYISVTDKEGKPVKLNDVTNMKLFEDDSEVTIHEVKPVLEIEESELSKFYIVMVLDNSFSMQSNLEQVKQAADQFIDELRDKDKIAITVFDERKEDYKSRIIQPFTNIKFVLKNRTALRNLTQRTYLYDAIFLAIKLLEDEKTLGRKAIVVLSDGKDIGSKVSFNNLIQSANRCDIPIYSIDFTAGSPNNSLKEISQDTNGKYFRASKIEELASVYSAILEQLIGQYRVTYTAANLNWSAPVRNIRVELNFDGSTFSETRAYRPDIAQLHYLALRYKETVTRVMADDFLGYIESFPNSEWRDDVQFKLGVFYEQRGFYDQAQAIYDELLSLPQTEWRDDVMLRKGKIYENLGDFNKAIDTYNAMVQQYPDSRETPYALIGMARSYTQIQDDDNAEKYYLKIKDNYSGSEITDEALLELADLKIKQQNDVEAKLVLYELVDKYKESNSTSQAYLKLASLSEKEGDYTSAIEFYDKSIESTGEGNLISCAYAKKGDLLYSMGNYESAIESYEIIINQYDQGGYKGKALLGESKAWRETKQYPKMRTCYDKIKDMKVNNEDVGFDLDHENSVSGILAPNMVQRVTTLSGAYLATTTESELTYPLEISIKPEPIPETDRNLSIAGDIYNFSAYVDTFTAPVRIALPYNSTWIDTVDKTLENFKLYTYQKTRWEPIPNSQADTIEKVIYADVTSLSLKAIMFQPPQVIRFEDILFAFNSAELTEDTKLKVDQVFDILSSREKIRLEIQGHTDSIGTDIRNLELSQKRADTIGDYLVQRGIDETRVIPIGYGKHFPIASNSTEEGRSLNRRTEFVIISKGEKDIIDFQQRQLGTKYTIELGVYNLLPKAAEQSEILKKEGINVLIKHDSENDQSIYRLWCGYFDNPSDAESFAQKIVAQFVNLQYKIIER